MKIVTKHDTVEANALELEIAYFLEILHKLVEWQLVESQAENRFLSAALPDLADCPDPYARFVNDLNLTPDERIILILALLPVLRPSALDILKSTDADKMQVTDFGGHTPQVHKGFIPTVETALFLLAGRDLGLRTQYMHYFQSQHPLLSDHWLRVEQIAAHEPFTSALLLPSKDLIDMVTLGRLGEPVFGAAFPAERIVTNRTWEELVLPMDTKNDVQDIIAWIKHEDLVMRQWRLADKVSPGFRCLFHGPPGTGKTFTATLLGQATGRDVYRIDLSMIVSKYIGETEKNLRIVFDKAEKRGWILFFDEADALFGKRTEVSDSKDRYANQEVSYLLQRVENFDGVVILATNNRENMDKAFTRRFQVVVNFPMPNATERLRLWQSALPTAMALSPRLQLSAIADRYELTGGSIMNVVRHCALRAAMRGAAIIEELDMVDGIRREYQKAGRILHM